MGMEEMGAGAGIPDVMVRSEWCWDVGTAGLVTFFYVVGSTMQRVPILICVASANSVISSTLDQ